MFKLYWLPLNYRMHFKILLLVDKCLNGLAPIYLSELLRYSYSSRLLRSSSQNFLAALKTWQLDQTLFNFRIRLRVWLTKQYFDPNFGRIFGITLHVCNMLLQLSTGLPVWRGVSFTINCFLACFFSYFLQEVRGLPDHFCEILGAQRCIFLSSKNFLLVEEKKASLGFLNSTEKCCFKRKKWSGGASNLLLKAVKSEIQKPSTCRATLFRCKFWSMFGVINLTRNKSICCGFKKCGAMIGWFSRATRKFVAREVVSLMKNEQQSQNL